MSTSTSGMVTYQVRQLAPCDSFVVRHNHLKEDKKRIRDDGGIAFKLGECHHRQWITWDTTLVEAYPNGPSSKPNQLRNYLLSRPSSIHFTLIGSVSLPLAITWYLPTVCWWTSRAVLPSMQRELPVTLWGHSETNRNVLRCETNGNKNCIMEIKIK